MLRLPEGNLTFELYVILLAQPDMLARKRSFSLRYTWWRSFRPADAQQWIQTFHGPLYTRI